MKKVPPSAGQADLFGSDPTPKPKPASAPAPQGPAVPVPPSLNTLTPRPAPAVAPVAPSSSALTPQPAPGFEVIPQLLSPPAPLPVPRTEPSPPPSPLPEVELTAPTQAKASAVPFLPALELTTAAPSRASAAPSLPALELAAPEQARASAAPSLPALELAAPEQARASAAPSLPALELPAPAPSRASAASAPVKKVLSVAELTRQIKGTLESGFSRVLVRGEISGFRGANARGHLYFSLKDADAQIDTKIWASTAQRLKFKLRDGLAVVIEGHVDLYEPQGRYSLIVQKIDPEGEGALALAFQQLKDRLAAEGLLGDNRKRPPRPLPYLPRRIGVVTSRTGAALQDFLRVLHQRHPRLSVLVCDARVQGEGSAAEVVRALERLARTDVDVIVVTRGGGSIEDLWTFNEEIVARAIHACPVPVVSAIGHEIDFTIADFVADYRAPTPSAAAERLAPVLRDLEDSLRITAMRLRRAMERQVLERKARLGKGAARLGNPLRLIGQKRLQIGDRADGLERALRTRLKARGLSLRGLSERLSRQRPQAQLSARRQALRTLEGRLQAALRDCLRRQRDKLARARIGLERTSPRPVLQLQGKRLHGLESRLAEATRRRLGERRRTLQALVSGLDAMSPLRVMARGYAVAFRADGHIVRRAADVAVGERLSVRLLPPGGRSLADCEDIQAQVTATFVK